MKKKLLISLFIFFILIIFSFSLNGLRIPKDFPINSIYSIEKGSGLNYIANDLVNKKIIKSSFYFKFFVFMSSKQREIMAGDYVLTDKESLFSLIQRLTSADYRQDLIKVTIPEGLSVKEIGDLLAKSPLDIDSESFVNMALDKEGYLFPDTYFFLPNTDPLLIIKKMQETFKSKLLSLESEIEESGKSFEDIIKMASILEREARTEETRKIISGILWERLALDMPLQVDVSFKYINGKTTADLTLDDLKIDSPYNSYLYKGLPPTPICNPGLDSILASLRPTESSYLYFLSDNSGNMHYAENHDKHLQNKEIYLR